MDKIIERLSKERLVGYFLILWGLSTLWLFAGFVLMNYLESQLTVSVFLNAVFGFLINILMGAVLLILGHNIINKKNIQSIERLLGYSAILWGLSHLWTIVELFIASSNGYPVFYSWSINLSNLFTLLMGIVLVLLGWKILRKNK